MKSISKSRSSVRLLLRELGSQLAQLNHRVGAQVSLRDVDLECLDLIARQGPLSPSALAHMTHLHPATVTGVLDRMETQGWIARERAASDRRAVRVRALAERSRELVDLYAGMNNAIDRICASYGPDDLATIADFLVRVIEAGRAASAELTGDGA